MKLILNGGLAALTGLGLATLTCGALTCRSLARLAGCALATVRRGAVAVLHIPFERVQVRQRDLQLGNGQLLGKFPQIGERRLTDVSVDSHVPLPRRRHNVPRWTPMRSRYDS